MDKIDKIGIKILYYMKSTKRYKRIEIEKHIERIHQVEKIPVKYLKFLSSFALTRLTQQDLINRIDRGVYQISNKGLKRLEDNKAILQEKINKYFTKCIINEQMEYFDIFCDLIIHSRGEILNKI